MSKSYFKYLISSNKVLIAFVFVVQVLICVIENLSINLSCVDALNYSGNIFFAYVLSFILPVLLLHYVQNKKSVDSYFALPVKRRSVIISTLLFAWLLVMIPLLILFIGYIFVDFSNLTVYLVALFVATLSFLVLLVFNSGIYLIGNNNIDGIVMMIAYSLIPFIAIGLVDVYFTKICYGFSINIYYYCRYISLLYSSFAYLNSISTTSNFIPWIITIIIYFGAGYVAINKHYLNRKAERAQTISDNIFAYPFVIHAMTIMLLFMVSISYVNYYQEIGDMALLYFLVAILFEILTFIYRRMIKVKIRDIIVILTTIILSISFVKISLYYEGFGLSYLYDHNPKNVAYSYNMWNVQDEEILELLQAKYDEVNYYTVYFKLDILEKDMEKNKEINEWFNSLRDKSIKKYFHGENSQYDSTLRIINNGKEVNGEVSYDYYPERITYYYNDVDLSLEELKYINDNYTTVYIDADVVINLQDTFNKEGVSADRVLTQSGETTDYIQMTLNDILDK